MDKKTIIDLLKDEYIQLHAFYEDVDKRTLTIKGWSVTIALAAIGAGFVLSPHLWFGAVLASIVFWYLEAFWRNYHFFLSVRIKEIEKAFRKNTLEDLIPLQLYTTWTKTFDEKGSQTSKYFFKSVTLFPHLFIVLFCMCLYVLWLLGTINAPIKVQ